MMGPMVWPLREWFALPFVREPERDALFGPYFQPRWIEELRVSLCVVGCMIAPPASPRRRSRSHRLATPPRVRPRHGGHAPR